MFAIVDHRQVNRQLFLMLTILLKPLQVFRNFITVNDLMNALGVYLIIIVFKGAFTGEGGLLQSTQDQKK